MKLKIHNTFIAFSAARDFLNQIGIQSRAIHHFSIENQREHSLSDSQAPEHQIRFYTRQRILRSFRSLAYQIKALSPSFYLQLTEPCDFASREFFQTLAEQIEFKIEMSMLTPGFTAAGRLEKIRTTFRVESFDRFLAHLLNVGDSWLAVQIADDLRETKIQTTPSLLSSLAAAYNLQERNLEAEFFYRQWAAHGGLEQARAFYSLSMLWARHHKANEQDLDRAGEHLQEAYQILQTLDPHSSDVIYETVFNRNGFALILFRRGQAEKAASLLCHGIERLKSTPFISGLHETVLQNNLGRVYAALGDSPRAIQAHRRALEIDPMFPEYHLDLANHLIDEGQFPAATTAVKQALRLDPTLPEALALQGFLHAENGNFAEALQNLQTSFEMGLRSPVQILDLAKMSYELNEWQKAKDWLSNLNFDQLEDVDLQEAKELKNSIEDFLENKNAVS